MSEIKGNSQQFAEFYRWSFGYMKDDKKRKIMDLEVAVQSWPVFLKSRFGLTDEVGGFCCACLEVKREHTALLPQFQLFTLLLQPK